MRIPYFLLLVSCSITLVNHSVLSQTRAVRIDGDRAKSYVAILAADSLEGRRSGLSGGEKAAKYIAVKFQEFGLKPGVGDTSYFQRFAMAAPIERLPMTFCILPDSIRPDTVHFSYGDDFVSFAYGGAGRVASSIVFISYGIHEPTKGRDDLNDVDLTGKIVLALRGTPSTEDEAYWDDQNYNGYRSSHARDAGAVGFLQVGWDEAVQGTISEDFFRADLPAFWLSKKTCEALLKGTGLTVDSLRTRANAHPSGYHYEVPCQVLMEANAGVIPNSTTCNVVARFPGADPNLKGEIVLLGAHMDHLGVDALGRVYNGAEDNGSGTALLMEIAHALATDPIPPRRSVYFCAFAGEELGLTGSTQFAKHPPIPLDSVVAVINMDMVGEGGEGISLGGTPNFPQAWDVWSKALPDFEKQRIVHFKPGHNSDHAPFEDLGIPAFSTFGRGEHFHYHNPLDDVELIQPKTLEEVGEVDYAGLRAFADYPAQLTDPQRYARYLYQSAETVQLGAPALPLISDDDSPDLILYEAGKSLDPSGRNRLRKFMVDLERLDRSIVDLSKANIAQVKTFAEIPGGKVGPAVALGVPTPAFVEGEPEIFDLLRKLDLLFIHVPQSPKGFYFGVRGMKKEGRELVQQLEVAPQVVIWETRSFSEAVQLLSSDVKPSVIRVNSASGFTPDDISVYFQGGSFLWLSPETMQALDTADLKRLGEACGWKNIGVDCVDADSALPLINAWVVRGYTPLRIRSLLGENLLRFLKKHHDFERSTPVATQ
ncbi:MAG: M28 family peptidase [bacterium]|nr:M28 family peptidase [bacterium]